MPGDMCISLVIRVLSIVDFIRIQNLIFAHINLDELFDNSDPIG